MDELARVYCSIRRHGKTLLDISLKTMKRRPGDGADIGLKRFLEKNPLPDGTSLYDHLAGHKSEMIYQFPNLHAEQMTRLCMEAEKLIQPYHARFSSLPWEHGIGTF